MTKHTPGPWEWIPGDKPTHRELVIVDRDGDDSILYHGSDWRMREADAALIAAAPDMYDALHNADALTLAALNAYDPPSALIAAPTTDPVYAALVESRGVILSALALADGE